MAELYWCFDTDALGRAAEHGCLDEDIESGTPLACSQCLADPVTSPAAPERGEGRG